MEEDNTYPVETEGEESPNVLSRGAEREIDFSDIETPEELRTPTAPTAPPAVEHVVVPPALERVRPERPPLVPRAVWIALGVLATVIALATAGWFVYASSTVVTVPDVIGVSEGEAVTRLAQAQLEAKVTERRFSAEAAGTVLEQSPGVGTESKKGDTVGLVVSAGTEELTMPDVVGDGIALARGILEEKGLVVTVETVPSDTASDTVLATTPAAGAVVRSGDVVRVQVASPLSGGATVQPYRMSGLSFVIDPALPPKGESDYTMGIARRLQALLQASGANVTLLRSGATTSSPAADRARAAQSTSATAGIRLLVRGSGRSGRTVAGPPQTTTSGVAAQKLLRAVANQLAGAVPPSVEDSATTDAVFSGVSYPWVSVGAGSADNAADKAAFNDPQWADRLATAIYTGIGEVFGTKEQ